MSEAAFGTQHVLRQVNLFVCLASCEFIAVVRRFLAYFFLLISFECSFQFELPYFWQFTRF